MGTVEKTPRKTPVVGGENCGANHGRTVKKTARKAPVENPDRMKENSARA